MRKISWNVNATVAVLLTLFGLAGFCFAQEAPSTGANDQAFVAKDNTNGADAPNPQPNDKEQSPKEELASIYSDPWRAVERIDAKIANSIVFLTIIAGLFPIAFVAVEYFRYNEYKKLKETLGTEINLEVERRLSSYLKDNGAILIQSISKEIEIIVDLQSANVQKLDSVYGRVMRTYLSNELSEQASKYITSIQLRQLFELQRSLIHLRSENDLDVQIGLSHFSSLMTDASSMTATYMLEYLYEIEEQRKIRSWSNRGLWKTVVEKLEADTGVTKRNFS